MYYRKTKSKTIFTIVLLFILLNLFAASEVADSTIVAKYLAGKITMGDINDRLSQIPPMYKSRYNSLEGKKELLDIICVETVFYLEALEQKVMDKDAFKKRTIDQIRATYFAEYSKDLLQENISFTQEEKQNYFKENHDQFKDRTFEEAEAAIESRLRPEKENAFIETKKDELINKFEVKINYSILPEINFKDPESNEAIFQQLVVNSSRDKIKRTVKDIVDNIEILPARTQAKLNSEAGLKKYVEDIVKSDVFYLDAIDHGYGKNESIKKMVVSIERNMALRTIYNTLVAESIDTSEENLLKFYNDNIKDFSSLAYRKIQTFGFENKKTAAKMHKKVKKLMKEGKETDILTLIQENSIYNTKDGILNKIYNNGIIPGIGKDEVYCDMVWATEVNKLSGVFKNSKDKYVFFRVLEDTKAVAQPFEEVKDKVKKTIMRDESKAKFELVKQELENKYSMEKYPDKMIVVLSAEEYFNKAEAAQKRNRFNDAIFYYDEIIKYHKNSEDDHKALFMKGFLYAEELNNKEKAIEIFEKFLVQFPGSDLTESAEYMLSTLKNDKKSKDEIEFED
ncbi:MAG: tetratricopeptide repeat protein [Candidatus Cloacimonetes bacterium]|nr:tetratricopeptide repeat protein [Candidatus Cloacimonadota bacterium]